MRQRITRSDINQAALVQELRQAGAYVWVTSSLGAQVPDLFIMWRDVVIPLEVKRPGHEGELTEGEKFFVELVRDRLGVDIVVTCFEDVVKIFEQLRR